ncbi:hypothetical protein CEXT_481321 [Caerostris extrusa]|uniref:Uncharacterized protein n=1 Tax=Caerostris extrusa TaxID=172846 RepID=A0AAV4R9Z0_CAEEX|nr:hypothetical protein CEXT_481321 [Caerostris extrusa]
MIASLRCGAWVTPAGFSPKAAFLGLRSGRGCFPALPPMSRLQASQMIQSFLGNNVSLLSAKGLLKIAADEYRTEGQAANNWKHDTISPALQRPEPGDRHVKKIYITK